MSRLGKVKTTQLDARIGDESLPHSLVGGRKLSSSTGRREAKCRLVEIGTDECRDSFCR